MTTPTHPTVQPHPVLPRSMPPHAGAPEASTWSTRSAASMNDVDTDQHRHTLGGEEGPLSDPGTHPDHVHNADERSWFDLRQSRAQADDRDDRPNRRGADTGPWPLSASRAGAMLEAREADASA